jgi:hypothetical protein
MAITTLDGVIAGFKAPEALQKVGAAMEAAAVFHTWWYTAGRPGAAAANAAGVNGRAVTPSLVTGEIDRTNPGAGNAYLGRLEASANVVGTLLLVDRLWENSGLVVTSTSAQAITAAAIPSRDLNGAALGHGVQAAIEWSALGGAGVPTVTLTYTDQDNNAGNTGTFVGVATPVAGTIEMFTLAAGDSGIRAPTSFIQSATRTSGTMHLILFRILARLPVTLANVGSALDAITSGMPRIYNDSCLQLIWLPTATTATTLSGLYVETQG